MTYINASEAMDILAEYGILTDDEIALVSSGWGHNTETYEIALFSRTGYRTFEQFLDQS